MKVSVIVPTIRQNEIFPCIESIYDGCQGLDEYEIVVVADFPLFTNLPCVHWILDVDRRGPVDAICKAERSCKGKYLFLMSDEDRLLPTTLKQLYDIAEGEKSDTIYVPFCGAVWNYYGRIFPPFPFVSREVIDRKLGGYLLDDSYGAHYADPDLGMRAAEADVEIRIMPNVRINHPNNMSYPDHIFNRNKFYERDMATFRSRWDHLGEFKE